jgi:hypothetical protein
LVEALCAAGRPHAAASALLTAHLSSLAATAARLRAAVATGAPLRVAAALPPHVGGHGGGLVEGLVGLEPVLRAGRAVLTCQLSQGALEVSDTRSVPKRAPLCTRILTGIPFERNTHMRSNAE